jgi:sporulation integral membrane protein YtvI
MWETILQHKEKWIFAGVGVALFLVFRYVFPLIWPFLIGAVLAAVLYPAIRFLHRKFHIGKGIGAVILLTVLVVVVLAVVGICGYGLVEKGYEIACDYEKYAGVAEEKVRACCDWIEGRLRLQRGSLIKGAERTVGRMAGNWQNTAAGEIFTGSVSGVKKVVSCGLFFVFLFLSTVLIVKEWDETGGAVFERCKKYAEKIVDFLKIFLGAQIRIIGVIALICLLGFWIAGVEGAFGLALLTACMDVLPFVGTGIILVPMMLWKVVNAQYYQAFLLLATYICCMIAREYLEPKFISAKIGISPVLTLLGIYVGIQIMGFPGIFLGPLYIVMLQILYDEIVAKEHSA